MKVTIKGITPSTIAFNTIGIVVRGDSKNMELYPESIARHIDVVNEAQLAEVNSLVNAGFIAVEVEQIETPKRREPNPNQLAGVKPVVRTPVPAPTPAPVPVVNDAEEIEDAPSTPVVHPQVEAVEKKPAQKSRGRPKGSKDLKPRKNAKVQVASKVAPKPVKKANSLPVAKDVEENSTVTVMTPSGARQGKMYRNATGEIPDGEITEASLAAMKKLEEEERLERNLPDEVIDESLLDPSERSGNEAVIFAGGNAEKVKLTHSILPEAKEIKDKVVEFIDQADKDADEAAKQAFIGKKNESDDDDMDFLEY